MESIPRKHQFTCVVNKKVDPAKLMNAIGHITAGLVEQYKTDTSLISQGIKYIDFTETMVSGNAVTQQEEFDTKTEIESEYIGICFFAEIEKSRELTKKFSLYVIK